MSLNVVSPDRAISIITAVTIARSQLENNASMESRGEQGGGER